jgi:hypothetical protein
VKVGTGLHVPVFAVRTDPTVAVPVIVGVGAVVNAVTAAAAGELNPDSPSASSNSAAMRTREESLSSTGNQSKM